MHKSAPKPTIHFCFTLNIIRKSITSSLVGNLLYLLYGTNQFAPAQEKELHMITVEVYINGEKDKMNQSRNVLSANVKYITGSIASAFSQPAHMVHVIPLVIPGKDLLLSKNLPDVLFKITSFVDGGEIPYADQLRDDLLASCIDLNTLHFRIGITNRTDQYGHSIYRT